MCKDGGCNGNRMSVSGYHGTKAIGSSVNVKVADAVAIFFKM